LKTNGEIRQSVAKAMKTVHCPRQLTHTLFRCRSYIDTDCIHY